MITISDIIQQVERLAGHKLNEDEGVHHGSRDIPVTGATVSWMATPEAIRAAGLNKHELLIVHESVYYPYDVVNSPHPLEGWENWSVNRQRKQLMDQYNLTCLRIHGSADEICVLDKFAEMLGLGEPTAINGLVKIYDIPVCTIMQLVQRVKQRVGMPALRVGGKWDPDRMVKRVGLPWGGLGLFVNVSYQQQLVELDCDVFIAGESDNYGFRFAAECDIPMIETSHELSENPGLRYFSQMLSQFLPEIEFRFHEDKCAWQIK